MDGLSWEQSILLAALGVTPYLIEALMGRLPRRRSGRRTR